MKDLSNVVRIRRLTLAGHTLYTAATVTQASKCGYAVEDGGRQRRELPRKTC